MWFSEVVGSNWALGYAQSTDGINWQKIKSEPILLPTSDGSISEQHILEPWVIKTDKYHLWYNSATGSKYFIRHAVSDDGINWIKDSTYSLIGEKSWENNGVVNPSVVMKNNQYFMWYAGWGSGSPWKLGLARSTDGINWTKEETNPLSLPNLNHIGGHSVQYINNEFHIWYHTGSGMADTIYHAVSTDGMNWFCSDNNCLILKKSDQGFDKDIINDPQLIKINSQDYLYYSGHDGTKWQIGLATEGPIIAQSRKPIIIIPGLFGSWNKQALVYNENVNQSDWKINPFVHEYDAIIQTLENLGYEENIDYFVFNYDWRKGLNSLADDLNNYTQQFSNLTMKQFSIVGHSLGGLVARIYAQKYETDKINKLITVGSPHQGVAQVYKTIEAGDIDRFNNYVWLASKFLIQLYRDGLKTDKQIINEKIPSIKDLLPTYNFLKDSNNKEIPVSNMSIKNDTLISYNSTFPNIYSVITSFVGEKGNTLFGFKVLQRTTLDKLLDFYPDGRPIENFNQIGDYTVVSSSAKAGNNYKIFELGHNELIYKKESIKEILTSLDIPYQENQIIEGQGTTITPSLLFLVLSPAEMKVDINSNTYIEKDGLIFIENAQSGAYHLELTGKEKGSYQVLIGQIGEDSDQWSKIDGEITKSIPSSQVDKYEISFNQTNPTEIPVTFDTTIKRLIVENPSSVKYLTEAKKNYDKKKFILVKLNLEKTLQEIFKARKKADQSTKVKLLEIVNDIENLYSFYLKSSKLPVFEKKLKTEIFLSKKTVLLLESYLLWQKKFGKNVTEKALLLKIVEEKLSKAEQSIKIKNFYHAEILLKSVEYLFKEIK